LLLLDEPASALDPGSRAKLRKSLLQLKKSGQTIIISSHILPDLAGLADAVGILERGKMVFAGPIDSAAVAQSGQMSYQIETLAPAHAKAVFDSFGPRLIAVSESAPGFEVSLDGGPEAVADLVEKLTIAGAKVCHVAPKESAIEAVYRMSAAERVA
jgi:ABC-2 type transport system ATP-binding protein